MASQHNPDMANNLTEKPGSLYRVTRCLLREDRRNLFTVARDSGLPFYWLRKFSCGEIREPGVNRVQRLYEFLTQSTLTLK